MKAFLFSFLFFYCFFLPKIFGQVAGAVEFLHRVGIVHRDLKPCNVLLNGGSAKVADFGFSTHAAPTACLTTFCGSPSYAAPELVSNEGAYVAGPVDMWALGVLLYYIVSARLPFGAPTLAELNDRIVAGVFELPLGVAAEIGCVIRGLLCVCPRARWSTADLVRFTWTPSPSREDQDHGDNKQCGKKRNKGGCFSCSNGTPRRRYSASSPYHLLSFLSIFLSFSFFLVVWVLARLE